MTHDRTSVSRGQCRTHFLGSCVTPYTICMLNYTDIKKDFPFFTHHPDIAYLDTGATGLKPVVVINAVMKYYEESGVNIHRGIYDLSGQATEQYENVRTKVADFIHANPEEIIFTSGATHGLNLLANVLGETLKAGDNIVLTRMEHHANLIPWQQIAKKSGATLRFIELASDYTVDMESARKLIDSSTKIVSVTQISNVLGTVVPIKEIITLAKAVGAKTVIDAAQGIVHSPVNVKELDCDFLVFSGHKLYGPTGVGVLYGKKELLEKLPPFFFGGDMIRFVSYEDAEWADLPNKFEAGTPPIASIMGLGSAIDYLQSLGWDSIQKGEEEITAYALERLQGLVRIIGPQTMKDRSGVISFLVDDVHPHDTGDIFNSHGVAVRVGHHCAMPLIRHLGLVGTVRASFGVYTTREDVDALVGGIEKVKTIFKM